MRLDHVSYVTSHDQLSDTVQRLGQRLGSTFVDGGMHPRFGTRNFTLPLAGGTYLEVVCPLDHPATEKTAFGRAVAQRAAEGGGWLSWVVSVDNISDVEKRLGREAVEGQRTKPDGTQLAWKQLGVLSTIEDRQLPFFVEWNSEFHPSKDGKAVARVSAVEIAGNKETIIKYVGDEIRDLTRDKFEITWLDPKENEGDTGIVSVTLETPSGSIRLD
jgi:hypothetical protein